MIMDNNNSNNNNSNKPNNKVNMPKFNLNWMYMIIMRRITIITTRKMWP